MKMINKICLLFYLSLIALGCGRQKAVSSTMTIDEQKDLNGSLAKLETTLKDHAPFIHAKLAPPATDNQLAELQRGLDVAQVQLLKLWYQWHNGCLDHTTNILPLGWMLSISESLQDRKMIQGTPFVDAKRKGALKILDDGAGDGFFLDITSKSPRVFYHMLEDPYPRDFGTLQDFIQFITQIHDAGLSSENKNGTVDFDLERYEKLESDYLGKLDKP